MQIYWIFLIIAIVIAICSDKIDEMVNGNRKLKKWIIALCIGAVIIVSFMIKFAL